MSDALKTHEELLSSINLFAGLSGRHLKKLAKLATQVQHDAGNAVATEGRNALGFHLILSGEAGVSFGSKTVRELHPGDYFGEISMIDGLPRSATVTATTALTTLVVPHFVFEELLDDEPAFARGLLKLLCARLREAESNS